MFSTDEDILVFSFVGMRSQEIKVTKNDLYVVMESIAALMQEVIVTTGYQNIEKRKLSSSVFTIDGDIVKEGAALGLDNMLQGKIPCQCYEYHQHATRQMSGNTKESDLKVNAKTLYYGQLVKLRDLLKTKRNGAATDDKTHYEYLYFELDKALK